MASVAVALRVGHQPAEPYQSLFDRARVSRNVLEYMLRISALVLCTATLSACADSSFVSSPDLASANGRNKLSRIHRLGVGDKIKLGVYGEQDLSGQFEVNALGVVPVPLIGEVPAKGLSIQEFREHVQRRLSDGYVKSPKVSVEIIAYRPIFVHGEVKSGGEFTFKFGTRLRDVVAMAGGYTYRAEKGYALVTREGEQVEMRLSMASDELVLPGDNVRIPERFF